MLLLQVLEKRKGAIAWKMSNIKGIIPSYCIHKILMEDDYKQVIQPQRHLNPKVQNVVKNEIVKLLDSGLIYPISDSSRVSPIQNLTSIKDKKGAENLVVDHLSRLENPDLGTFTEEEIADEFLDEYLMILKTELNNNEPWFGVPKALISDRGTHFCNSQLEKALQRYGVTHKLSMAYHPQSKGQIEVTNKDIKRILERSVGYNPKDWSEKLNDAFVSRLMQLNELAELRYGTYENTRIFKE
ncbi:reverse transcriptase domain-containing protein [Tanacetum coccineum]